MTDIEVEPVLDFPMRRVNPLAPAPEYAELRKGPPRKVRLRGGTSAWLVTRHEDVRAALMDARLSVNHLNPGFPRRIQVAPTPRGQSFWRLDEPEHGRLRHMVMPEFTARATRANRHEVERLIDQLLDAVAESPRPVDLVSSFALPLPCLVIGQIFGVPDADQAFFAQVSREVLAQDAGPEKCYAAYVEMTRYLDQLITERTREPRDDLLSRLVVEHVRTGQLSHDDLIAMARLMLVAGHETTANQLALSIFALLTHPEHLAELKADPALLKPAVEELLRFWSIPEDNIVRVATADFELGGAHIAEGDGLILAIPAANHDESVFPDAGRLDFHRDSSAHIAFGVGPHYCPGAPLAVLELELALDALFKRFPDLRLACEVEELSFRYPTLVYGVARLPVTW